MFFDMEVFLMASCEPSCFLLLWLLIRGILSEQILTEILSNPKLTNVAFLQFGKQAAQP